VGVQPKREIPMKASLDLRIDWVPSTYLDSIAGLSGPIESIIRKKSSIHKKGPRVDPCPGPNDELINE
jgi:hypothetical protein